MKSSPSKNAKIVTTSPEKPQPPPSPYVEKTINKSLIRFFGNLDLKDRNIAVQYLTILSNNGLYYFDITRVLFACKEAIVNFECRDDEKENNYKSRDIPKYFWADDKGASQNHWVEYDIKTCNKIYRAELRGVPFIGVDNERFFDTTRQYQVRYDNHSRVRMGKKQETKKAKVNEVGAVYKWYWLGDYQPNGLLVWNEYSEDVCKKLEEGYAKNGAKVDVDSERFVDTKLMRQRRKDHPFRMREVKREKVSSNASSNSSTPDISTPTKTSSPPAEDTPNKSMNILSQLFGAITLDSLNTTPEITQTKSMASKILEKFGNKNNNNEDNKPVEKIYGLTRDQFNQFIVILEEFLNKYPEKNEHSIPKYKKMKGYDSYTSLYTAHTEIEYNKSTTTTTTTENQPEPLKEISQTCEIIIRSMIQLVLKNNLSNQRKTIYLSYNV